MISFLSGKVLKKTDDFAVVLVNGVGYKVYISTDTLSSLTINESVNFEIHTEVKEDSICLYGFINEEDLKMFEHLLSVSGVGPKTAMNITKSFRVSEIVRAIQKAQTQLFTEVSGIGKKLAQKIILELQPKLGKISELSLNATDNELVDALMGLGFTKKEASQMGETIDSTLPLSQRIKLSLKNDKRKN
ncbi:MAG: Holliday junction branch migration protein RuvA [Patescibacteria group bacterium]